MSDPIQYNNLENIVADFRSTLTPANGASGKDCILIYAYNGTGKTRLSGAFKDAGKNGDERDTLYFNAFTEDLFFWDNDLENDTQRVLKLNENSRFFDGIRELEMESKIGPRLERYADYNFFIDYDTWTVKFSREIRADNATRTEDYIKISRGEENLFIWCFFLAVAQLAIEKQGAYDWVKYIYIDDPISSLDDNNAIALANDLTQLIKTDNNSVKTIISTHHILFFNILCNDLRRRKHKQYFLHRRNQSDYSLRETTDTPFFHHVALLSELKHVMESGNIKTYHFNSLRTILEKTSSFFGFNDFGKCIHGIEDQVLFERALNLLSHGKYSVYEPIDMIEDTKELFIRILTAFLEKYEFYLTDLLLDEAPQQV